MNEQTIRAMKIQRVLKAAEEKFRRQHGVHTAFPWSAWGDRPRSGAQWSEEELDAMAAHLNSRFDGKTRLKIEAFAELAWMHGRSANAVYQKLASYMGWKSFNQMFADVI